MNTTRGHEYHASELDGWGARYDRADHLHAVDARKTNLPHERRQRLPCGEESFAPLLAGPRSWDSIGVTSTLPYRKILDCIARETPATAATDTLKRMAKRAAIMVSAAAGRCRDPARDEAQNRRRTPHGRDRGRVPHGPALPQGPPTTASTPSSPQPAITSATAALAGRAFADRRTFPLTHGGSDRPHRLNARVL